MFSFSSNQLLVALLTGLLLASGGALVVADGPSDEVPNDRDYLTDDLDVDSDEASHGDGQLDEETAARLREVHRELGEARAALAELEHNLQASNERLQQAEFRYRAIEYALDQVESEAAREELTGLLREHHQRLAELEEHHQGLKERAHAQMAEIKELTQQLQRLKNALGHENGDDRQDHPNRDHPDRDRPDSDHPDRDRPDSDHPNSEGDRRHLQIEVFTAPDKGVAEMVISLGDHRAGGATVWLDDREPVHANDDGTVRFVDVGPGYHMVEAVWETDDGRFVGRTEFRMGGEDDGGNDEPEYGVIEGVVWGTDGHEELRLAGALVQLRPANNWREELARTETDDHGNFRFGEVPAGEWELRVSKDGYTVAEVLVEVVGGRATEIDILLEQE